MGKGSKPHEEVVKYLCATFGQYNHEDCVLKKIYPSDWEKQYIKERNLECDYVVKNDDCYAIVDVVYKEAWMESLGKVIGYLYEVASEPKKEIWIVFTSKGLWEETSPRKKKKLRTKEYFLEYRRDWHKIMLKMSKKVVKPELIQRLKFFEFDFDKKELVPID